MNLRSITSADYRQLSEILDDEWLFRIYSKEKALEFAECYLVHCMNGSNLALTLTVDDEPKGILILSD